MASRNIKLVPMPTSIRTCANNAEYAPVDYLLIAGRYSFQGHGR